LPGISSSEQAEFMARMLLNVFPGRIMWISYPLLKISTDSNELDLELNKLVKKVNSITQKGVELAQQSSSVSLLDGGERIMYLDLAPLQEENIHLYSDIIHHPGKLSEMIVKFIFFLFK
jgi:hypothetical protein